MRLFSFKKKNMTEEKNISHFKAFIIGAMAFMLFSKIGFYFSFQPSGASPVWPPSGICLALLVLFGPRVIWGVLFGSLFINVINHSSLDFTLNNGLLLNSLGLALSNISEYLLGYFLICKIRANTQSFAKPSTIFFTYTIALISTIPGALIGTATIIWTKGLPQELFWPIFQTWWTGDFTGIVVFTF